MKSKITLKTVAIISCAVLLTAVLTAGVMALIRPMPAPQAEQAIAGQSDAVVSNSTEQATASATDSYIGETEAKSIALSHAGLSESDVTHMFCKLDYDDGVAEYEVEFWDGTTEYDYEIDATSGEIIGYDYDMERYDAKPETTQDTTAPDEYIGEAEAKSIAFIHAGVAENDAEYIKCEFDFDDGKAEYDVEWRVGRTEYEYTISATDGTIWEHDVDYD